MPRTFIVGGLGDINHLLPHGQVSSVARLQGHHFLVRPILEARLAIEPHLQGGEGQKVRGRGQMWVKDSKAAMKSS